MSNGLYLETAFAIGARLCRDAIWDGHRCNWLGEASENVDGEFKTIPKTQGWELYSGTSGVALFLSQLYRQAGEEIVREVAEGALRHALSRYQDVASDGRMSLFSGWTGLAHACLDLGDSTGDERWHQRGLEILSETAKGDVDDQMLDVVIGLAGALPAVLNAYHRHGGDHLLDFAQRIGESILARGHERPEGMSWDTLPDVVRDHLNGFSHGTSGMAWALLELFNTNQDSRFRDAALAGFRYERHWYSPQHGNWPDLRDDEKLHAGRPGVTPRPVNAEPLYPTLWCHGAPGIGMARLRAWELLENEEVHEDLQNALRTTIADLRNPHSESPNYSLCHGRAGNADLLIEAAQVLNESSYQALAEEVGQRGIYTFEQRNQPWPSGLLGAPETPSLMVGVAGTGYFYLRLADPTTPSILLPVARR